MLECVDNVDIENKLEKQHKENSEMSIELVYQHVIFVLDF